MASISLTDPVAGTTATAGQQAANNAALRTAINGGLDNTNVAGGAAIASSKLAGGMLIGVRILTVTGTYTPTSGTNRVYIECVGAGGQGGGTALTAGGQNAVGGGGGGGGYSASYLSSGFSGVAFTIGAGGSTSVAGNNTGQVGADTTFNTTVIVAKGGTGGQGSGVVAAAAITATGGTGGSAAGGTGDLKLNGGPGGLGVVIAIGQNPQGIGGSSFLAAATGQTFGTGAGGVGNSYGGGGAGAYAGASAAAQVGGAGAPGVIRIWEFV